MMTPEKLALFVTTIANRNKRPPRVKLTPEQRRERNAAYARAMRLELLNAYGHKCACCGESRAVFLALDHIHNDGAQHRREVGNGPRMYAWLRKHGYPKDRFQLLCHNCNMAKRWGPCPHQTPVVPSLTTTPEPAKL